MRTGIVETENKKIIRECSVVVGKVCLDSGGGSLDIGWLAAGDVQVRMNLGDETSGGGLGKTGSLRTKVGDDLERVMGCCSTHLKVD